MPVWSAEEVAQALEKLKGDQLYPLWLVMVGCGLSRSEALAIDWEDIQEMPHTDPAFSSFNGQNIEECVEAFLKNGQSR